MTVRDLLPIVLIALTASSANAQTQTDLNIAAARSYARAHAELNRLYARVTVRLPADARAKLVDAQRRWIAFRDAECAFESQAVAGGSRAADDPRSMHDRDDAGSHPYLTGNHIGLP